MGNSFEQTDPSIAFEKFHTIVTYIYNSTCPMKQLRSKQMTPRKPWLSQELLKMINLRKEMCLDHLRFSDDERQKHFIDQKNKTNSLKRKKVKAFYRTNLKEKAGDPKGTWDIINGIIKGERKPQEYSTSMPTQTYVEDRGDGCEIILEPCSELEVKKLISSIRSNSAGIDGLNLKTFKVAAIYLLPCIVFLINISMEHGEFPDPLKIAKILPLPKTGILKDLSYWKPISVLPLLSKIYEKIIHRGL